MRGHLKDLHFPLYEKLIKTENAEKVPQPDLRESEYKIVALSDSRKREITTEIIKYVTADMMYS